jgi:hypothetical protein
MWLWPISRKYPCVLLEGLEENYESPFSVDPVQLWKQVIIHCLISVLFNNGVSNCRDYLAVHEVD